jgi:hypothetical protein
MLYMIGLLGLVVGIYAGALACDRVLERRLEKRWPLKAGDKVYEVKLLSIEYFGSPWSTK